VRVTRARAAPEVKEACRPLASRFLGGVLLHPPPHPHATKFFGVPIHNKPALKHLNDGISLGGHIHPYRSSHLSRSIPDKVVILEKRHNMQPFPFTNVRCPKCNANIGKPCRSASGRDIPVGHSHMDRARVLVTSFQNYLPDFIADGYSELLLCCLWSM
jgi:hypothetical protein